MIGLFHSIPSSFFSVFCVGKFAHTMTAQPRAVQVRSGSEITTTGSHLSLTHFSVIIVRCTSSFFSDLWLMSETALNSEVKYLLFGLLFFYHNRLPSHTPKITMSALLALADAATNMLSDEECGDVTASLPSDEASSLTRASSSSDVGSAVQPLPPSLPGKDVKKRSGPVKKRVVLPEAQVQALLNINIPGVIAAQAQPNSLYASAQLSALCQPTQLTAQLPAQLPAAPMPLSMLPKKKRNKKKEDRYNDLQGQYLATSWYFNESSFPVTLMAIIESQGNQSPCITFLSDDQRFVVIDPSRLEKEIFPKHFDLRTPTLEEFSEMLNLWGFEKSVDKLFPNVAVYKHEQFMKGDWEKCLKIEMPIGSLEQLNKIQVQPAKADAASTPSLDPKQIPRKRPRRGNGVPLPPPELVAGFSPESIQSPKQLAPSMVSIPRRISQEKELQSSLGNGTQSLLLSQLQLGQNQVLQNMMLGQPSNPQLQQNPFMSRRISFDSNPLIQRFRYPRPSTAIASETDDTMDVSQNSASDSLEPPGISRRISDDLSSLKGKLSSKQLDAMTEQFLAQSNARLKSRPAGIKGPSSVSRRAQRSNSLPPGSGFGVQPGQLQYQAMLANRQALGSNRRTTLF